MKGSKQKVSKVVSVRKMAGKHGGVLILLKVYGYTLKDDHSDLEVYVSLLTGNRFERKHSSEKDLVFPFRACHT